MDMEKIIKQLTEELGMQRRYVESVVKLMDEGNSIPFIARYRKEMHGTTDDTTLRKLEERLNYLKKLEERRVDIIKNIEGQDKMSEELLAELNLADTLAKLENLYAPYKQKRRTRATIAKEKGLEPLAERIFAQGYDISSLDEIAQEYIDEEKEVNNIEDALKGASDIIAEKIAEIPRIRKVINSIINNQGMISTSKTDDEESVYEQYYNFGQSIKNMHGHQILAVNRGEKEGKLKVSLEFDREVGLEFIDNQLVEENPVTRNFIENTAEDAYDRLLFPAMERSIRSELTDEANEGAIHNFSINLKSLLMQAPVKGHVTMGLDPGYRNGCKVAVVDATGKVLDTAVVYLTFGERQKNESLDILIGLVNKYNVEHIAIGNGTASRETEQATVEMIKRLNRNVSYMIVNEAGASIYSASQLAADEFPQYDVNLRSAISIARRLQDPLAELVKIEPKAIGVGQYQHDMPEKRLDEALKTVVEDCVNAVGVDLNTASPSLLSYVSGLNMGTAKNVALYREENGKFTSRKQLLKVKKLGPKAFEQCAGFLRVAESKSVLDNTGVHPESYKAAEKMLEKCGFTMDDVKEGNIVLLPMKINQLGEENIAKACDIGVPTLRDIVEELLKPGRDPRDDLPQPVLRTDVLSMEDIKPGMTLTGTVRNVIDFGVFVDIGVHQDGLVHISEISNRFIKHPSEALSIGDVVKVLVLSVDIKKKRISLSIKQAKQ